MLYDDKYDKFDNHTLSPRTFVIEKSDTLGNFAKFVKEINPYLSAENFELIYVTETYHEGQVHEHSSNYLTLIDNTQRNMQALKKVMTKTDVNLYVGSRVATCIDAIWCVSEAENPRLRDVFRSIGEGYKDIQNSI